MAAGVGCASTFGPDLSEEPETRFVPRQKRRSKANWATYDPGCCCSSQMLDMLPKCRIPGVMAIATTVSSRHGQRTPVLGSCWGDMAWPVQVAVAAHES